MRPFRYVAVDDVGSALRTVAAEPDAAFIAGGTNLVDLMKLEVAAPGLLVDVRRLSSDRIVDRPGGGVRIGAAVRNSELAADRRIRQAYPVLSQALLSGASGQLRNVATAGGNLLQRTRCPYFRDTTTPCNKRAPGSGCSALTGYNRDAAILGTSATCVATHPSDMAVALAALDAVVHTHGPVHQRTIPLTELLRLPAEEPERDTVLVRGELITAIDLPPLVLASNSRYLKVRDRASYAFALVSVAAALDVTDGVVREARIALGGVAHKPWRATKAERALRGAPAVERSFRDAAEAELTGARRLQHNAFKIPLATSAMVRVLLDLSEERS